MGPDWKESAALQIISRELSTLEGKQAVSMRLAEQYIHEFGRLASKSNTLIVPAQANDVSCEISRSDAPHACAHMHKE